MSIRSLTTLCFALLLLLPACSPPRPDLGSEFEAIGDETGSSGLPRALRHLSTGIELVLIEPGRFTMGSPDGELQRDGDEILHEARVDRPFYMGRTEITAATYLEVLSGQAQADTGGMPAEGVSWHAARQFIDKLNETGRGGWRLPLEIEWEYACRAGTTTAFFFGDELSPDQAHYNPHNPYAGGTRGPRSEGPLPVGSFPANPWGLHDMHGNVWEWCEDVYRFDLTASEDDAPGDGASRVIRGGAWTSAGKRTRCAHRDGYPPNSSGEKYGLRVAFTPDVLFGKAL